MDKCDLSKSYRHSPYEEPYPYTTIPVQIKRFANETPNKEAFVILSPTEERQSLTCKEVYDQSILFAKGLLKIGIKQGDVIGISFPNSKEWIISTFGVITSGAYAVHFTFSRFDGADIVQNLKGLGNVVALIFNPGNDDVNLSICKHIYKVIESAKTVCSESIPSLSTVICTNNKGQDSGCYSYDDIIELGKEDMPLPYLSPDEPCVILFTSGSTGLPKAIYRTHLSLLTEGYKLFFATGMTKNDIFLHDRVMMWTVAFPNVYLFYGITMVVFDRMFDKPRDTMEFAVKAMENEKSTVALLFPQCLQEYLKGGISPCSHCPLKSVVTTGLPIAGLCSQILGTMTSTFIAGYGNTELGAVSISSVKDERDYQPFSVGRPLPGIEIKVVNENGILVPAGTTGELCVRHHLPFLGFINKPEKNIEIYQSTGWFKMDDIGYMNKEGIFFVTGRKSDVMVIGGALVSPSFTESAIVKHPDVEEACVVPVHDDLNYQEQCACVVKRCGSNLTVEILKSFLSSQALPDAGIRKTRIPKYILFVDKLPRTGVGKIFRKGVLELAESLMKK